jgi:hypothetical protein
MEQRYAIITTRTCAAVGAFGWGLGVCGLVMPSFTAWGWLTAMGAEGLSYHPMLDYWLRMTAAAYLCLGVLFAWVAVQPLQQRALGMVLAVFQLACALVLLGWALHLKLPTDSWFRDVNFCAATGVGMLLGLRVLRS